MSKVHQIRELSLKQLDVAVAICEGYDVEVRPSGKVFLTKEGVCDLTVGEELLLYPKWSPTNCGNLCMSLMQKYKIYISYYDKEDVQFWYASQVSKNGGDKYGQHEDLMVAICQAIVCFVLDSIEITLPEGV